MTEPRILFVTGEYPPMRGGIADYLCLLREELRSQGTCSFVLSSAGSSGKNVSTVRKWNWGIARNIQKLVSLNQIDIVHIQYQTGAFEMHPVVNLLPAILKNWIDVPVVTTFHDLRAPYLFPKAGRLRTKLVLRMARDSSMVVVTNPQDKMKLTREGISMLEVPIGPSLPKPDRPRATLHPSTVAYFGFPSQEKGIFSLVESIGLLKRCQRPLLKIIGAEPPDGGKHAFANTTELESAARKSGVSLQFTGYLPPQRASNELNNCQAIAFPFVDGASLRSSALIAALNIGPPVVATGAQESDQLRELQSIPQLITVPVGDLSGFSAALLHAIDHGREAEPLPDRFNWPSIADRHREMYRSVVTGNCP